MLQELRKHLILFDTLITCLILSVVIFGACYMNITQLKENSLEQFISLRDSIEYKLQTETFINNTWLSETEVASRLIIQIEENGSPFFFQGAWKPSTDRSVMIQKAKKQAMSEGINTASALISFDHSRSSVFRLHGDHKDSAYACVCIIPGRNSYISLTLIQFTPKEQAFINRQLLLYAVIELLGCLLLFFVSCLFVNKAMKPVEENQQRQNEFVAAASHDLRSPLAVIQTNATALLIEGAATHHFVPKIVAECSRMSRLISDLLILASSDVKTWQLQKTELDTETYLIELYDSFFSLCQKSNRHLSLDLPEASLPKLTTDKDRLTQILSILIDNAISYSPKDSSITLRPYQRKSSFYLEVIDHGIGISWEQKKLIFNRFYRADTSRNDSSHFGLGLSVAKELTELMGGRITVEDTPEGGSTFIIELPNR